MRQRHRLQELLIEGLGRHVVGGASAGGELAALLRADLKHAIGLFLHLADFFAFVDRQRQRFFAVHIFAGLHRLDRDFRMPMIGRRHHHGFNIFAIEHLAIIFVHIGRVAADPFGQSIAIFQVLAINITHRQYIHEWLRRVGYRAGQPITGANEADRVPIVGRIALCFCRGAGEPIRGERGSSAGGGGGFQKLATTVCGVRHGALAS